VRKLLAISEFAKAGLNTDIIPWDLPPSFLTNIKNVRLTNSKLVPFGGSLLWATLPASFEPGYLMHVGSTSGIYWLIPGRDKVYAFDGTTFSDISSGAYPALTNEDDWTGCMLSEIPIIINPGHYPEYWPQQSGGIPLEPLPWNSTQTWEDVGETAKIIRSHKQFLFALGIRSGVEEYNDGVRWSAPADIGGVPSTWDHLDTTNVAGLTYLGADGGDIIDGRTMRDAFVVYRERSISIFDFVGGQFVWQIRHLSTTIGLIAADALVEVKGKHYFIGDGDILVNDGNTIESLLHNKIRNRFSSDFDTTNYRNAYAVKSNITSEIWFCVPQTGKTYASIAYVYNWRDNTWAIRELEDFPFANYGPQSLTPDTWATIGGTWENARGTWALVNRSPFADTIVAIKKPIGGNDGELRFLDYKASDQATQYSSNIERVGVALEGLNRVTTITSIYPHMEGPGDVFIQVGSQDHPGSAVRWKPALNFKPGVDRKLDIRTTGELHAFRIYSDDSRSSWAISGLDVEYVSAGER
jgi:hypothetical protein